MKRKFFNGLLLAAALATATSSFVSCKDYDGDNYAEQRERIAAQEAAMTDIQDYLQRQIDHINKTLSENEFCTCEDLEAKYPWLFTNWTNLKNFYDKWGTYTPENFWKKSEFNPNDYWKKDATGNAALKDFIENVIGDTYITQWLQNHNIINKDGDVIYTISYDKLVEILNGNSTSFEKWLTDHGFTKGGGGGTTVTITYNDLEKLINDNSTDFEKWLTDHGFTKGGGSGTTYTLTYDDVIAVLTNNSDDFVQWLKDRGVNFGGSNPGGLTKEDVEKIIQDWMVDNIKDNSTVINQELNNIINNYITTNDYLTRNQIENLVNNLLQDYYTKNDVTNLLNNYITNDYLTQNYYTKDEVVNLINQATQGGLTEDDVKRIINENVDFTPYVKKDDLNKLIEDYLKENNLPQEIVDWLNGGQITHPAFPSLDDYVKNSTLDGYVKLDGLDDLIKKYLDEHPSSGSCSCDLSEYAKKSDVYTKSEVYTQSEVRDLIKDFVTTSKLSEELSTLKDVILYGQGGTADDRKENSLISAYIWAEYAKDWIDNNKDKFVTVADFETFKENYEEAKKNWDKAWDFLKGGVKDAAGNDLEINTLQDLYDALNNACNCEDLSEDIAALDERLTKEENLLKGLTSDVKKLITDINVNGTYNPFFGYFSASAVGLQSNILAVTYGKNTNGEFDFPTYEDDFYYDTEAVLSQQELSTIRANGGVPSETIADGKFMIKNTDDNAGHIYLTVNPSNVDFSSTVFDLSRTDGSTFPVTLSPMEPCYERLGFGYTRANSANGFYKVKAKITYNNAKGMVPYQLSDLKDWASVIKSNIKANVNGKTITFNNIDITGLANVAYQAVHNINADRLGVRAQWTNSEGKNVQVTSQYDIAAIGLHPLNFGTLDEHVIPVIDRHWKLINGKRISKRFLNILKQVIDIDNLRISEVYIEREISDKYDLIELAMPRDKFFNHYSKVTILIDNVPTDVYTKKENAGSFDPDEDMWYQIVKDDEEKGYVYINVSPLADMIYDDLNEGLEPFNESVGDFNAAIDGLPKAVTGIINRYTNKANKYLKLLHEYIDRANLYVQPALFVRTSKNWTRLSTLPYRPSSLTAGTTLRMVPSTWTLEILVPCFMKHVAVSNVYNSIADVVAAAKDVSATGTAVVSAVDGDANCQAIMKTLNEQIGSSNILQELKPALEMTPDASMRGKVIEIAYTAVDYDGRVSGDKYYVVVK